MKIPIHRLPLRGMFAIITKLPHYLRLAFRLMRDRRAPALHKAFLIVIGVYVAVPIDFIPEAILPPLGYAEDLLLLLLGVHNLIRFSPPHVVKEHARSIAGLNNDGETRA